MNTYIKCDRVGCGYVLPVPKITKNLVGTPCPHCGSNMLTESDFKQWQYVAAAVKLSDWVRRLFKFFGIKLKTVTVSLGKDDLLPGETYFEALARKIKQANEKEL